MKTIPLSQLAESVGGSVEQLARAIKISIFNDVIRNTRVDTGRLRGNWQTSVSEPITSDTERLDPNGAEAQAEVERTVKGDTIDYLTNNLPYAAVWEERDGMVDKAVARIERTVKEALR